MGSVWGGKPGSRNLGCCQIEEKGIGWTKRGSASEFFIPKQEETRRASHLCGVGKGWKMDSPGLRSLGWSPEAPETAWHSESSMSTRVLGRGPQPPLKGPQAPEAVTCLAGNGHGRKPSRALHVIREVLPLEPSLPSTCCNGAQQSRLVLALQPRAEPGWRREATSPHR